MTIENQNLAIYKEPVSLFDLMNTTMLQAKELEAKDLSKKSKETDKLKEELTACYLDLSNYHNQLKALAKHFRKVEIPKIDKLEAFITGDKGRTESTRQRYRLTITQFYLWLLLTNRLEAFNADKLSLKKDLEEYSNYLLIRMAFKEGNPLKLKRNTVVSYLTAVRQYYKHREEQTADSKTPVKNKAKHLKNPKLRTTKLTEKKAISITQKDDLLKQVNADVIAARDLYSKALEAFNRIDTYKGTAQAKAQRQVNKAKLKLTGALRDRAIIFITYYHGLRVSEVHHLNKNDISQEFGHPALNILAKGQDVKQPIPLIKTAAKALIEYLDFYKVKDTEPLFKCLSGINKGGRLSKVSISQTVKALFKKASIITEAMTDIDKKAFTAHSLRHSFGTHLLRQGATIQQARQALRHKNIASTQIYVLHNEQEDAFENPINTILEN